MGAAKQRQAAQRCIAHAIAILDADEDVLCGRPAGLNCHASASTAVAAGEREECPNWRVMGIETDVAGKTMKIRLVHDGLNYRDLMIWQALQQDRQFARIGNFGLCAWCCRVSGEQ